jgi:hypothetical protein
MYGKSGGTAQGVAVQRTAAAKGSEAGQVPEGARSVVAIQAVVAAKGSETGGGATVGADVMKAAEPGSPQQEKLLWVWRLKKQKQVQQAGLYTETLVARRKARHDDGDQDEDEDEEGEEEEKCSERSDDLRARSRVSERWKDENR